MSTATELKATNAYIKSLEKKYGKNIKVRYTANASDKSCGAVRCCLCWCYCTLLLQ